MSKPLLTHLFSRYRSFLGISLGFGLFPLLSSGSILLALHAWSPLPTYAPGFWWLFFALVSLGMAFALIPTTLVALLSGYLFGYQGLWGVLLSYPLAALGGRCLGLQITKWQWLDAGQEPAAWTRFRQQINRGGFRLLILARLSPILPFAVTNIWLAQLPFSWDKYLLGTMLGMLPRTMLFFYTGMHAEAIWYLLRHPTQSPGAFWLSLCLVLITLPGLGWILYRAWKKSQLPPPI